MDDLQLYMFPGSNACISTTLLLQHAGVPYRERRVTPGLHALGMKLRGFEATTVPAACVDGMRIQGSRGIARFIATRYPEARLLPPEGPARDEVLEAERQGERLQNAARRLVYVLAQEQPSAIRPLVDANFARVPAAGRGAITRAMIIAASKGRGASSQRAPSDLDRVKLLLDDFDTLVAARRLGSDEPNVADFQIAPNLSLLAMAPSLGEVITARPCWVIAERLLPRYPLEFEVDAPKAWADALAPS